MSTVTFNTLNGIGNLGNPTALGPLNLFVKLISQIIGFLTVVAGLWFIFQIVMGAFQWLQSGGDKQALEVARKRLTNSFVGLFIVVAAYALIGVIGYFLGFDIINIGNIIESITV